MFQHTYRTYVRFNIHTLRSTDIRDTLLAIAAGENDQVKELRDTAQQVFCDSIHVLMRAVYHFVNLMKWTIFLLATSGFYTWFNARLYIYFRQANEQRKEERNFVQKNDVRHQRGPLTTGKSAHEYNA